MGPLAVVGLFVRREGRRIVAETRPVSRRELLLPCSVFVVVVVALVWAGSACAASGSAGWLLRSVAYPSDFTSADNGLCESRAVSRSLEFCDTYMVIASNVGAKATGAVNVTLKDTVPAGLVVRNVSLFLEQEGNTGTDVGETYCKVAPGECVVSLAKLGPPVQPDGTLRMYVSVTVPPSTPAAPLTNAVKVSAPGTVEVSASGLNSVESGVPGFGPGVVENVFLGLTGGASSLAGGHPYELYTAIPLSSVVRETPQATIAATSIEDVRDVIVELPVGMSGSGVSAAQCTLARLASKGPAKENGGSGCPKDTVIGHIRTVPEGQSGANTAIYNLVPEKGVAAELGFIDVTGSTHVLDVTLAPTGEGYVLRTTAREIPQIMVDEVVANVYGNPTQRDGVSSTPGPSTFTNPSDCNGKPLVTTVIMDSWQHPGSYNPDGTPDLADPAWVAKSSSSPPVTGCEQLAGLFEPTVTGAPTSSRAGGPAGLDFTLSVPAKTAEERSTPPLRDTTITLPEGMTVNPSSANGLQACSLAQVGISEGGVPDAAAPACPDGSKLGTVELETPALPSEVCKAPQTALEQCPQAEEREHVFLPGSIYLAAQDANPFHSLLAIYIVIDDPRTGLIAKIPAKVTPDPATGQLTTTVTDTPQFPFTELRTHFFTGDTAALTNPPECGTYPITTSLTPWSAPESGPPATPSTSFAVNQAADGSACKPQGFAPSITAGTTSTTAAGHTPLTVTFSRQDTEQQMAGVSVSTPLGLLGTIRGIPQCSESQANTGTCPASSLLGEATTAVGAGPDPYVVHGGQVYLTGPYKGAPFGMSIVVPTTAGPFTLTGNAGPGREVVRAQIKVDPHTARITVQSDPLPTIPEGIPLQIRTVTVTINRPGFIFNPTNCNKQETTTSFTSTKGATSTTSTPYYASHCAELPLNPAITATTQAHTSKVTGASLTITVKTHPGETNLSGTEFQIPSQLPARNNTLKGACLAKVFEANPATCPPASAIGTATVSTPVLQNPLTGPVYLVSYGNEGFPRTSIVLQGEGITTILEGHTDIKNSITYSRFQTIPDVPFTTFTASLPEGPHSIFGAYLPATDNNPCGHHLTLPTHITGQNNRHQTLNLPIQTTGCPTRTTIQNKTLTTTHHQTTLTLLIYTPTTTTLHITAHNPRLNTTTHTKPGNLQTITLHIPQHHPPHTTLTLTTTTPNHHTTTTHTNTQL